MYMYIHTHQCNRLMHVWCDTLMHFCLLFFLLLFFLRTIFFYVYYALFLSVHLEIGGIFSFILQKEDVKLQKKYLDCVLVPQSTHGQKLQRVICALLKKTLDLTLGISRASLVAQLVKKLPAMQETWVWSLGWKDPLEKGMATCSSILNCRIP